MKSADLSADHRPIAKTPKLLADGKKYNKVFIIYFLSADEKRAKIWHRPIAKTPKLLADGKKYNTVFIIYFLSADEKRAKIWHFIGRLSAGLM